jgi:hypothetical protein
MNANELANLLEVDSWYKLVTREEIATVLRNQQAEIKDLKNANRFIQNFAEEQHQRAVALEMRELTDEEIDKTITDCGYEIEKTVMGKFVDIEGINMYNSLCGFARAILKKAQEK